MKVSTYTLNGVNVTKTTCRTNEEWRQQRCHSIGASAVGVLIGENPFTTPLELARRMREEMSGVYDYTQTMAMRVGHAFEGGVAQLFAEETGRSIVGVSSKEYIVRRDDIPFMHASPDRTYWLDENGPKGGKVSEANKGILECKTTSLPVDEDNPPLSWIFQLQTQLGITGCRQGALSWFSFSTRTFGYKFFDFDNEIFSAAVEVCRDFWQTCIVEGRDPEPVNVRDILSLYPQHTIGKTLTADDKTAEYISEMKELKAAKKELEDAIDDYATHIKMQFTDEEAMVDTDGKILCTFKTNAKGQRTFLVK